MVYFSIYQYLFYQHQISNQQNQSLKQNPMYQLLVNFLSLLLSHNQRNIIQFLHFFIYSFILCLYSYLVFTAMVSCWDLFGSQIPETTGGFQLQISCKSLGICDPNKYRARNCRILKLDSKSKYLNFFYPSISEFCYPSHLMYDLPLFPLITFSILNSF